MTCVSKKPFFVVEVWAQVISLVRCHPSVAVPFFLWGFIDLFLLFLLVALSGPLLVSAAPSAGAPSGAEPLHHAASMFLLPRFFSFSRDVAGVFAGALCVGTAVSMMGQALRGERPAWVFGAKKVMRRYARYATVWALVLLVTMLVVRVAGSVGFGGVSHMAQGVIGFFGAALIQMLFVFAIPALVIENKKIGASLSRSFSLFNEYRFETLLLVGLPYLCAVPFIYATAETDNLAKSFSPAALLCLVVARALAFAVINYFMISAATVVLLRHRGSLKRVYP